MDGLILVVDDSLTVRSDLLEAFAAEGLPTLGCATIAEAKAALATRTVALAVLDVLLPDGDGITLLEEIRATPKGAQLPVLMLSTEAEVRDRIRGLMTGSSDYIGKPYDRDYVIARAWQLMGRGTHAAPSEHPSVLVIDDSVTFREALCEALRGKGYIVYSAASGEEGLRSAATNRPSVVIVDGVLPGIDGTTVVRKLRLDAALRQTPCIMLTGSVDRGAELVALNSGADGFARKEEDLELILARVRAVMRSTVSTGQDLETASLLGPKKILAVDDSITYLEALAATLREDGYDVIMARSGEEALEMVAVQTVDCILLDRLMPGLGGTATCQRIKSTPILRDIPLIMLTGTENREAMIEGLATGADDYVLKSSELEVLKARVSAQLRRKQFEDENRRIRMELLSKEMEAAEARAAHALAESRAQLLSMLEDQNRDLEIANEQLRLRQQEIDEKNQQLEEANRLKSEFLSTMSHELRTPLNAIIGFAELFKDGILGELSANQHKYISAIFDSGEHLLQLINEVLDLSKIEAGKMQLDLEPIDLEQLLSDSLSIVKERASVNDIRIAWEPKGCLWQVRADRRRFRQVLYNLLSNAVKFTPAGGQITLDTRLVPRHTAATAAPGFTHGIRMPLPENDFRAFAQISVSDSGIGIEQHDMHRLFKPFTQLDSSLSRKAEGTGLGLAVVQQLVELHGGAVGMTSEAGAGCCFTIWLPLWLETADLAEIADRGRLSADNARLTLVIEDDDRAAELVTLQLTSAGFTVQRVSSAEEALAEAERLSPKLIILDLLLPGMSGWDFLSLVKDMPGWASVPVVVISIAADQCRGIALGASLVLQKPVRRQDMVAGLCQLGFPIERAQETNVLLVDDDPTALTLMASYLEHAGYKTVSACGGQAGLDAVASAPPDLIILDLVMPEVSGFDFIDALNSDPEKAAIPTIVVTASQPTDEERRKLSTKILSIVNKVDFNPQGFMDEVHRALRHAASSEL